MPTRRDFMAASLIFATSGCTSPLHARPPAPDRFVAELRRLEQAAQGRLGVHVIDTASGREFGQRSAERFQMLSTFKLLASAYVLVRVDRAEESLQRRIPFTRQDLIEWSPVTEKHVEEGSMDLASLCHAAMTVSDNAAANLILQSFGGPRALTQFLRQLGDSTTRLDRFEPQLNVPDATQPLDTTTPRAMAHTLRRLLFGETLSKSSRDTLLGWLLANTTGSKRLRAGVPTAWKMGEKTGSGWGGAHDVGVAWPPGRAPLIVAAYLQADPVSHETRERTLMQVGQLLPGLLQRAA